MRGRQLVVALLLPLWLLIGCGDGPDAAPADCPDVIQYEGKTYTRQTETGANLIQVGEATRGVCADVDPAGGISFPDDAPVMQVGRLGEHDLDEVVGAELEGGAVFAYIADHLADDRREQLARQLQP